MSEILTELKPKSNMYIIGSVMYGLQTPKSDVDTMSIYWDLDDHLRIFKKYPDVKEYDGNNTKLFSLPHFAYLLSKGNPNMLEVVYAEAEYQNSLVVTKFMEWMRQNSNTLIHNKAAAAYLGHLYGIEKEISVRGVTPKRLSHAFRMIYSLEYFLKEKKIFLLREHEMARKDCLSIKLVSNENQLIIPQKMFKEKFERVKELYEEVSPTLQSNESLKEVINTFFAE